MPQRITPEQYQKSRANGWTDEDLQGMGYEIPAPRAKPGLPGAAPVDATGPRAGGGGLQPVADIARMGAQGASFGWADEAVAGVRALSPNTTYKDAAADEQRKVDEARQKLGGLATVAELAGGIAVPGIGTTKAVAGAAKVGSRGAQLGKQVATAVGAGAASGGLAGAGYGRAGQKGEDAVAGAGTGALFGLFASLAPAAVRQGGRYLGMKTETTATEKTADALQDVIARQGKTPNRAEALKFASEMVGPSASGKRIMDTSREMQELSVDAAHSNKAVERTFDKLADQRIAGQNTALADDFAAGVGAKPGVDADRIVDRVKDQIKQFEDVNYPALFAKHPGGVNDPQVARAWDEVSTYLKSIPQNMEANQVLADRAISDLMDQDGLTLQGLHRLKTALGDRASALNMKKVAGNLSDDEAGRMVAYSAFTDRLKTLISNVPGGKEWAQLQNEGAKARALVDALEGGKDLMGANLKGYTAEKGLADARASLPGKGAPGYRQGAASRVRDEARQATQGSDAFLNRLTQQDATTDVVDALGTPQSAQDFRRNMGDRRAMSETNKLQKSKATGQKEILKGARARSTALAFGEAGGFGSLLTGGDVKGPLRLAGGALLAKAAEGRRGKATEQAAGSLAELLRSRADDPDARDMFYDMAMALERLQRKRISRQAGASAALSPLFRNRNDE